MTHGVLLHLLRQLEGSRGRLTVMSFNYMRLASNTGNLAEVGWRWAQLSYPVRTS